jgi:hypothetical protein
MMRLSKWLVGWAIIACGCHSGSMPRVTKLVGEVHIHGFLGGVHPAALFVRTPVPADAVDGDSIYEDGSSKHEGSCVVTSSAAQSAQPPFQAVNAGPIRILGGAGIPRIDLAFKDEQETYLPVGELPRRELFTGGERLTIEADGAVAPAFHGSFDAPARIEIVEPLTLTVPKQGLTVRWRPDHAERILLELIVSRRDGRWGVVRCKADDTAGHFTFPAKLVAGLPEAPRDLQLVVTRNQIVRVATAVEGTGVILHASYARKLDGKQDR